LYFSSIFKDIAPLLLRDAPSKNNVDGSFKDIAPLLRDASSANNVDGYFNNFAHYERPAFTPQMLFQIDP
jgi:hypothetical protein